MNKVHFTLIGKWGWGFIPTFSFRILKELDPHYFSEVLPARHLLFSVFFSPIPTFITFEWALSCVQIYFMAIIGEGRKNGKGETPFRVQIILIDFRETAFPGLLIRILTAIKPPVSKLFTYPLNRHQLRLLFMPLGWEIQYCCTHL